MTRTALLVEDDGAIATVITAALGEEGFAVDRCDSIAGRDRMLADRRYDVMLTDVVLGDGDGIETLGAVQAAAPEMPVIILSAQNTLDTAIRATDTGALVKSRTARRLRIACETSTDRQALICRGFPSSWPSPGPRRTR